MGRGRHGRNDRMVDELLRDGAIRDRRIEAAFRAVPRHWFLPHAAVDDVYTDRAVVTLRDEHGVPVSSSSQPTLMADMLAQLAVGPGMSVLEIGTGTGYNAAILGQLVGPGGSVVTIDVDPEVTGPAERHLRAAGADNVTVLTGDGWAPTCDRAAFDGIEVTVGAWDLSPAWVERLAPGGTLVVPLWLRAGQQASVAFRREGKGLGSTSVEPCGFMRMRGPGAGDARYERVGRWTVSVDRTDPERMTLLAGLLGTAPTVRAAPPLERGWFTAIALGEEDAVHLFAEGDRGPVVGTGILHASPPGLALVESHPLARPPVEDSVLLFGHERALDRLLDLVRRTAPVDVSQLTIRATPTGAAVEPGPALARLARPHFTLVVAPGS